jgi:hypothetical protein
MQRGTHAEHQDERRRIVYWKNTEMNVTELWRPRLRVTLYLENRAV